MTKPVNYLTNSLTGLQGEDTVYRFKKRVGVKG